MRPSKSILDESFAYTPSARTAVDSTWRRYGWVPTTDQERAKRRHPATGAAETRVIELATRRSA